MQEMQERWVQSLGKEDSLEEEMATHSSILVGRIPYTEEPGRLQSMGLQRVGHDLVTEQQQQRWNQEVRNLLGLAILLSMGFPKWF